MKLRGLYSANMVEGDCEGLEIIVSLPDYINDEVMREFEEGLKNKEYSKFNVLLLDAIKRTDAT